MFKIMRWKEDDKPVAKIFNELGFWLGDHNEEEEHSQMSGVS